MRIKSSRAIALAFAALLVLTPPAAAAQTVPDPAAAVAAEQAARQAAASARQAATPAPFVEVWGDGPARTDVFFLPVGQMTAVWTANIRADATEGCLVRAVLYRAEERQFVWQLIGVIIGPHSGRIAMGETQVYGVQAGLHYIEVLPNTCSWSVRIQPS